MLFLHSTGIWQPRPTTFKNTEQNVLVHGVSKCKCVGSMLETQFNIQFKIHHTVKSCMIEIHCLPTLLAFYFIWQNRTRG